MSRISQLGAQLGNRVRLLSALTAALLWAVPHAAQAAGYVYQKHTVNAGVVFAGSASDPATAVGDPAPYLFYVLNNRPDARPAELTLVNPQAPATVTPALNRRWGYALGNAVTPYMAGYWEVPLHDVSSEELQQYDVLYLPANGYTFSPADNEKLRRFVDSGGQLFVEYNAASGSPGLFSGVTLATGASATLSLPPTSATTFLRHPLLSQPYLLSPTEVSSLGDTAVTANLSGIAGSDYVNLFGPVLVHPNGPAVIAGQLGGGQIIASVQNIGQVIGGGNGANYLATGLPPTPSDFAAVPAADLKFLSNLVSWAESHPSEYKTSHGNASTNGLAAFSTSWLYPVSTTITAANTPPAAAVWGNFVYAMDAGGTLRAFNAYPGSNLTGPTGGPEPVTTYPANAYDQVWQQTIGLNTSAPTVVTRGSATYVIVETTKGGIAAYDAVTGAPAFALTNPAAMPATYSGVNAPSPTYYDGRIYAGQADGTLSIYDLNDGTSANIPLNPSTTIPPPSESVVAPPSVGLLASGDSNVVTAIVPTTQNIYTVLLGAHNEPLKQYNAGGALAGYSIDRSGRYILPNLVIDTGSVPAPIPYYSNGVTVTGFPAQATNPQDPLFAITDYNGYFTDWYTDFAQTVQNNLVANLNFISANTILGLNNAVGATPPSHVFSAPAIDRRGDYYYTLNANLSNGPFSYLIGVKNSPLSNSVQLKFRFRIPTQSDGTIVDADGVNYGGLVGSKFVGAPVVDDQGNVYAVAAGGAGVRVLCFKANQQVSTEYQTAIDLTQVSLQQNDEVTNQANIISPGNTINNANGTTTATGQYTPGTNQVTFYNFGARAGSPIQQIAGNLTEPQPVVPVSNGTVTLPVNQPPLSLHTNLAWYTTAFTTTGTVTGLTKVGSALFLTDGTTLYSLPAAPKIGPNKLVSALPSKTPLGPVPPNTLPGVGAVAAPPSVGGGVLIVNGALGIEALTRQVTVVADNHRVLGVDGNGAAVWAVDATTRTSPTGGVTKVPFSHPVSLSQFADNEFLVADTGNNRCVRFDSGGNVQWELTRFSDPKGLMGPGQPDTLSQPTSVQPHILPDPDTTNNPNGTYSSYLIADSGNDRIVEVTDRVDSKGNVFPAYNHVLTWETHTADINGRRYRYGSATYYRNTVAASGLSIAATVTNTRIGKLAASGALGPASGDAPGGCLVVFNYPAAATPFNSNPPNDLAYVTPGFYTQSSAATPTYTPYTVKNPRFLSLYTPQNGVNSPVTTVSPFSFLYADDNGAFDLTFDSTRNAFIARNTSLQFLQTDYQNMTTPINAQGVTAGQTFSRSGFPFVPSCIQRFDADGSGISHYLITQTYAQGEVGGRSGSNYGAATYIPPGFGGEAFEVYYDGTTASPTYQKFVGTGTYAGHTLSRPDLTGPLTQPSFALRLP